MPLVGLPVRRMNIFLSYIYIKVKEPRNRPGVAQRVPVVLGSQIHDIQHMKVVRLSASRTGHLYPQEMFLVLIFTSG